MHIFYQTDICPKKIKKLFIDLDMLQELFSKQKKSFDTLQKSFSRKALAH